MKLKDRINACWCILTNKRFYCVVVTDYYSDGSVGAMHIFSSLKNTKTAIKHLIEVLKCDLKHIKHE